MRAAPGWAVAIAHRFGER